MPSPSMSFITRSVMTTSKVDFLDQPGPLVAGGGHAAAIADSLQALGHGLGMGAGRCR